MLTLLFTKLNHVKYFSRHYSLLNELINLKIRKKFKKKIILDIIHNKKNLHLKYTHIIIYKIKSYETFSRHYSLFNKLIKLKIRKNTKIKIRLDIIHNKKDLHLNIYLHILTSYYLLNLLRGFVTGSDPFFN